MTLLFIVFTVACVAHKDIQGKYRSNKAELGFFITEIELKSDNTFDYKFHGDLQNIKLQGSYEVNEKNVYLRFDKMKNELEQIAEIVEGDTIINLNNFNNFHIYDLKTEGQTKYHLKYKYSTNKLRPYHIETGELVRKAYLKNQTINTVTNKRS